MNPNPVTDNNQELLNPDLSLNPAEQLAQNPEQVPLNVRHLISPELWATFTYEQKGILADIDKLPSKLMGVVPETVWSTLPVDQKIEFLYTHGVIPRGAMGGEQVDLEAQQFENPVEQYSPVVEGEIVENQAHAHLEGVVAIQEGQDLKNEFKEAVLEVEQLESSHKAEMESLEKSQPGQAQLPAEDKARIEAEQGKSFIATAPKLSGYKPDDSILNNLDDLADGPASLGTSWVANILKKLTSAFSTN